jgi:hypothetical protein
VHSLIDDCGANATTL